MSKMQNNLGRGLDDLIGEVAKVRAVPTRAPAPPPAAPAPPPPAPAPAAARGRWLVPTLVAALAMALITCALLLWKLGRVPEPTPVVQVVVPEVKPLELPPPPFAPPAEPEPVRDGRLDWARQSAIAGVRVESGERSVRWIFDEPVFKSRDQLRPGAEALLQQVAAAFQPHAADCVLVVAGHTDDDPPRVGGPYRDNITLGYLRALAVAEALRVAGVPPASLRATSLGAADAPFPNSEPAGKARNRTVTLRFEAAELTPAQR